MQDYDFDYGQNADEIKKQEKDANYQRLLELIDYDDDDYQDANEEVSFEETKNVESRSSEGYTDGENKELIQAQSYDRTFILNGPIVKVYQNAEESGLGNFPGM